jgi:hypothetical protein
MFDDWIDELVREIIERDISSNLEHAKFVDQPVHQPLDRVRFENL